MTYPYNDETMVFDEDEQRYILTAKCVLDELNIDLNTILEPMGSVSKGVNATRFLNRISMIVYNQVYLRSIYNEIQEKLMKYAPSARKIIKDAMKEQVEYFIFNGDLSVYSGVDFRKGTKTANVNDRILAPMAEQILAKPLKETRLSLLYQGSYTFEWVEWANRQE